MRAGALEGRRSGVHHKLHGGAGPAFWLLRSLLEEEAIDKVFQSGGDGGAQAGGVRVVKAEPPVLPLGQSPVVPASDLALMQDNPHQVEGHRAEGSPVPQRGQPPSLERNGEGSVQLAWAQRSCLKATHLEPEARQGGVISCPARGGHLRRFLMSW